jgi:membrane protein YdbS with pleckstrin-like domain
MNNPIDSLVSGAAAPETAPAENQKAASVPQVAATFEPADQAAADFQPPEPNIKPAPAQETDVWWGSYSAWTMTPSLLLCIGLTALIAWGSWQLLPRGWVQLAVLSLAGAVWLLELIRFGYRLFGYNYRLTTHRLFHSKGLLYNEVVIVDLTRVTGVKVKAAAPDGLLRVGKVYVDVENGQQVVLAGVQQPVRVAERIRECSQKARERMVVQARM